MFRLTPEYIATILPKRCPVFKTAWGRGRYAASMDRIRPALGYIKGNVAVISVFANSIKQDARAKDVEKVAAWMRQQGL